LNEISFIGCLQSVISNINIPTYQRYLQNSNESGHFFLKSIFQHNRWLWSINGDCYISYL